MRTRHPRPSKSRSLVLCLIVLALVGTGARAFAAIPGDINDDGRVDVADLLLLLQIARDPQGGSASERQAADVAPIVSGEGPKSGTTIDAADVLVLARALSGEDVDGDGLSAPEEAALGLSPVSRNTDGMGPDDGLGEVLIRGPMLDGFIEAPSRLDPAVSYRVDAFLGIGPGASLRIPAGTRVEFDPGAFFSVSGQLLVEGSTSAPVVLAASSGTWAGIEIRATLDQPETVIRGASISGASTCVGLFSTARVRIEDSVLRECATGVIDRGGLLTVRRSTIENPAFRPSDDTFGAILRGRVSALEDVQISGFATCAFVSGSPTISGSTFSGCDLGLSLAVPGDLGSATIIDNAFSDSNLGLELDVRRAGSFRHTVTGNDFTLNDVHVATSGFPSALLYADISGNFFGTAIAEQIAAKIPDPNVIYYPYLDAPVAAGGQLTPSGPGALSGVVASDRTLDASLPYDLSIGLIIAPGATLTVPAGTEITVEAASGPIVPRVRVFGALDLEGAPGEEISIRSGAASPAAGDWPGIAVEGGALAVLHTALEHASAAVSVTGSGHAELDHASVRFFEDHAVSFDFGATGRVDDSIIDPGSTATLPDVGVDVARGAGITSIRGNTIRGTDTGVRFGSTGSSRTLIADNLIEGNASHGLLVTGFGGLPVVSGNRILDNGLGLFFQGPPGLVVNDNEIAGNADFNLLVALGDPEVTLDARRNFWGTTSAAAIAATIFDGSDDPSLASVSFCPFLAAFQGSERSCGVPRVLTDVRFLADTELSPGDPYVISGTLEVAEGATLTVQPGTTLQFEADARLSVVGALVAQSPANDIVFTSNSANPSPGGWAGIVIEASSDGTLLDGVKVRNATTGIEVRAGQSSQTFVVRNSTISDFSSAGIRISSVKVGTIENNTIQNFPASPAERVGDGVAFAGAGGGIPGGPTIVSGNTIRGVDCGVGISSASPILRGNLLEDNNCGIAINAGSSPQITDGNRIVGNGSGIITRTVNDNAPVITGNAIFGNDRNYVAAFQVRVGDALAPAKFEDVGGNFWGSTDPVDIATTISGEAGESVQSVDFLPILDAEGGDPLPEDGFLLGIVGSRTLPPGSSVVMLGNVLVAAGEVVEIGAGSTVEAFSDAGLGVDGTLLLQGEPDDLVRITPFVEGETWLGLDIRPGSTGSIIDHARLERVSRRLSLLVRPGVIDVRGAELTLTNSEIVDFTSDGNERQAAVVYQAGSTGLIQGNRIDNTVRTKRESAGILLEETSVAVLDNTVAGTKIGLHIYGSSTSLVSGNTLTDNDLGIFLEGTLLAGGNPAPRIRGNAIFGNGVPGGPVENIVLVRFGPGQTAPIDATGNFFGLTTTAEIAETIISRSIIPGAFEFSGYLDAPAGVAVPGSVGAFTSRVVFGGLSAQTFEPASGATLAFDFTLVQGADVAVDIYDEADVARVNRLRRIDLGSLGAGSHQVVWDGKDDAAPQAQLVPDGAYKFVIEASFPSGSSETFDPPRDPLGAGAPRATASVPSEFAPYRNEHLQIPYTVPDVPGASPVLVSLIVELDGNPVRFFSKVDAEPCLATGRCFFAFEDLPVPVGTTMLSYDGRDSSGEIVQTPVSVGIPIPIPIQANAALVQGTVPQVSGHLAAPTLELRSDPYLVVQTLDQATSVAYCLDREASVTAKLLKPGATDPDDPAAVAWTFFENQTQPPTSCDTGGAPHAVELDMLDPADRLCTRFAEDGVYTIVLQARPFTPTTPTTRTPRPGTTTVRSAVEILGTAFR